MDVFIYQAALLCAPCATEIKSAIEWQNMIAGRDITQRCRSWEDSDSYPQGPHADGGGEADTPQHCDGCGLFLENPLTQDGYRYVNEKLIEHARDGSGNGAVLKQWAQNYNAWGQTSPAAAHSKTFNSNTRWRTTSGVPSCTGGS
jgi:hypothetical protein